MIGGNIRATLQTATTTKNRIGESIQIWQDVAVLYGWLDLMSGDSRYGTYNAKIQESTHVFICDYVSLEEDMTAENCRMVIEGKTYDVTLLDNPMELNRQWEILLRYTGGQDHGR